jgi:hypothetical protein
VTHQIQYKMAANGARNREGICDTEVVLGEHLGLSDVEILGDDAALVLDALQGTAGTPNSLVQQLARVGQADPQAVAVNEQLYGRRCIQTAGVARMLFTPLTATQTITLQVIRPIKFYNLMVPRQIARFFVLVSAKINGNEQLRASDPQPLEAFSEVSVRARFRWEIVSPSSPLVLQVMMSVVTADRFFECTFLGAAWMKGTARSNRARANSQGSRRSA